MKKVFKFFKLFFLVLVLLFSVLVGVLRPVEGPEIKILSDSESVESEQKIVRYSDYVMSPLKLDEVEKALGEHYFNSIFCSLAGISFILILSSFIRPKDKVKKGKKTKKEKGLPQNSIISKTPNPINPTQEQHNLKF